MRHRMAAGALRYARKVGAHTIALTCNENSAISKDADHSIEVVVDGYHYRINTYESRNRS